MQTHVRALGIIHIVFGCIGLIGGLAVFLFFGGIAGLVGATDTSGDAWVALPILGGIGFFVFQVPGALFLAFLTFIMSLLPMGPPLVWIPAVIWLVAHDRIAAARLLTEYVDNLLMT